eukprot:scaffold1311_cov99-Cylindrotheca_fusiformis.AAC.11
MDYANNAATKSPRGERRKASYLLSKLKSSTTAGSFDDYHSAQEDAAAGAGAADDGGGDVDPFEHIKTLEDIEASIPSKSPRSERRKKSLRARLKAMSNTNDNTIANDRDRSIKSSDGEMPSYMESEDESMTRRVRRGGKKKHSSSSSSKKDKDGLLTYDEMIRKQEKVERRGSMNSTKSGASVRSSKSAHRKKKKSKRRSSLSSAASTNSRSVNAKEKARAAREARAAQRANKATTPSYFEEYAKTPEGLEGVASFESEAEDASTATAKSGKGYESDGVLGQTKKRHRRRRHQHRQPNATATSLLRGSPTTPEEERRQTIMDDLDTFDDRESITTMYLKRQMETLKKQVETLTSEKKSIQEELEQETQKNDALTKRLLMMEHSNGAGSGGNITTSSGNASVASGGSYAGSDVGKLELLHKEEKQNWQKQLKEKDVCIDKLQRSINQILVSKDVPAGGERDDLLIHTNDKITVLEETIDLQKSQINDLTLQLAELTTATTSDTKQVHQLKEELKQAKADKVALNRDLEKAKLDYEASMAKKDETVTFFQQELAKLKKSDAVIRSPRSAGPSRRRRAQSPGRLNFLVSPFRNNEVAADDRPTARGGGGGGAPPPPLVGGEGDDPSE